MTNHGRIQWVSSSLVLGWWNGKQDSAPFSFCLRCFPACSSELSLRIPASRFNVSASFSRLPDVGLRSHKVLVPETLSERS